MVGIDRGWLADEVTLRINNEDRERRCIDYSVNVSVFQQPAVFTATVGAPKLEDLGIIHDTEMPFELRIRHRSAPDKEPDLDVPVQTGAVDRIAISDNSGTTVQYTGRDRMRGLMKSYFKADTEYSEKSYFDLVVAQLKAIGVDTDVDLLAGEEARTKMAVTGTQAKAPKAFTPTPDGQTEVIEQTGETGQTDVVYNTIKGNAGEQRRAWLRTQLDRAGLFLWCMSDGKFCLMAPNGDQEPAFEIIRYRNGGANAVLTNYVNDSTNQHHKVTVHGRAGGGKDGQRQIIYTIENPTMMGRLARYGGEETVRLDIDDNITTSREAEFKARRLLADERRAGFSIEYEFSGHTVPCISQPGKRTVPLPNFVCHVNDEILGFDFDMYVGETTFSRSGNGTKTKVKLYRPSDLLFATESG